MAATIGHVCDSSGWATHPIRVLVVDDSAVARCVIRQALTGEADIEVVAVSGDGPTALRQIQLLEVDAVTLDLSMPGMDGLTTLSGIRRLRPTLPVIMLSAATGPGATATVEALSRGAADYVTKPTGVGAADAAVTALRDQLVPRLRALCPAGGSPPTAGPARGRRFHVARHGPRRGPETRPALLAIGASTGGPTALTEVLAALPADLPVPVVVVQHMPPDFTGPLARRLDLVSGLRVREAVDGAVPRPGECWVAPGAQHLRLRRTPAGSVVLVLDDSPPEHSVRPSVDVLLRSVAETHGGAAVAAILTGMGEDGARGARALRDAGGFVVVQDDVTSVVWGMPGAVVRAGAADRVLPLSDVAAELVRVVTRWQGDGA